MTAIVRFRVSGDVMDGLQAGALDKYAGAALVVSAGDVVMIDCDDGRKFTGRAVDVFVFNGAVSFAMEKLYEGQ